MPASQTKDVIAYMAPRDAAIIIALADAREMSATRVAQTLVRCAAGRRGWGDVATMDAQREQELCEALKNLDEETIRAKLPRLSASGARSPVKAVLDQSDFEVLSTIDRSASYSVRKLIEEALAHLRQLDQDAVEPDGLFLSDEATRAAEAIDGIEDAELRRRLADTVERMAMLCGATARL